MRERFPDEIVFLLFQRLHHRGYGICPGRANLTQRVRHCQTNRCTFVVEMFGELRHRVYRYPASMCAANMPEYLGRIPTNPPLLFFET